MCIVSLHTSTTAENPRDSSDGIRYPFILLANRDEEYDRPTSSSFSFIDDCVCCITDLVYGNTWMGINVVNGNMAILTNVDDDYTMNKPTLHLYNNTNNVNNQSNQDGVVKKPAKVIRSKLLIDLLKHCNLREHINEYEKDWLKTKGFIIICGNLFDMKQELIYFTNRVFVRNELGKPLSQWPEKLKDRLIIKSLEKDSTHCISNSFLNDDLWQKVKILKEGTNQICKEKVTNEKSPTEIVQMLSSLLNIRNIHNYEDNFISVDDSHLFTDEYMKLHNFSEELVELVHKYRNCTDVKEKHEIERKIDVHLYDRSTINEVFVHYKSKFTNWKSKSQSIVIVDSFKKKVYFYFRDVNEYSLVDEDLNKKLEWICQEVDFIN